MALDAQRAAESASAELALAQQQQAAAEQQAAELEERLAAELAAQENAQRSANTSAAMTSLIRIWLASADCLCADIQHGIADKQSADCS